MSTEWPVRNSKLRLLNSLREGKPVIATFSILKGVRAAQVLAHTGVDAVFVDCEHGNVSDADMHDMVAAVSGAHISAAIRLRGVTRSLVARALDTGAHAVLAPMISTADAARALVSFAKFPPRGERGQGGPFACFALGLATPAEYVAYANENLVTMVQIETREGVENVEEICAVEGIDVIFIGPNDLSIALLGRNPADWTEPVFLNAVDKVVAAARKYGKKTGVVVVDGETARRAREKFDVIVLSADVRALQGWYSRELEVARS